MPEGSPDPKLDRPSQTTDLKRCGVLIAAIAACWIPALVGADAIGKVGALFALADGPNPYFIPGQALLLYLWSPLVVASACVLLLSPGLFLTIALNGACSVARWIVTSIAASFVVVSVAAQAVQAAMGAPLVGSGFACVVIACSLACAGLMLARASRKALAWPLSEPHAAATLASLVVVPILFLIVLTPKFYWENFNGDGVSSYESARRLLSHALPFWPTESGTIASFVGMKTFLSVYPNAWFLRLFGEGEASARLPYLIGLVGLYAALLGVIQYGRQHVVSLAERWLLWLALIVFSVVMAFSSTYEPYQSDLALPAVADVLEMALLSGFLLMFLCDKPGWMALCLVIAYAIYPHCVPVAGLWMVAATLLLRPIPVRQLAITAGLIVLLLAFDTVSAKLFLALHMTPPGGAEHDTGSLLERLLHPQWRQLRRFAWAAVPAGILPFMSLFAWRWQDRVSRCFTLVIAGDFLFFFLQQRSALHYFVPAMVLPLIVFWRMDVLVASRLRTFTLAGALAAGLAALVLSWPSSFAPFTATRRVGLALEDRIGGYEQSDPAAFARLELLHALFPRVSHSQVPDRSYGGTPISWYYYANRPGGAQRDINYVMQALNAPPPVGSQRVAEGFGAALYVLDAAKWDAHKAMRPALSSHNWIYVLPKWTLFVD